MSGTLYHFLLSICCIVAAAMLFPGIETIARRVRGDSALQPQREVVHLTPRPRRRNF